MSIFKTLWLIVYFHFVQEISLNNFKLMKQVLYNLLCVLHLYFYSNNCVPGLFLHAIFIQKLSVSFEMTGTLKYNRKKIIVMIMIIEPLFDHSLKEEIFNLGIFFNKFNKNKYTLFHGHTNQRDKGVTLFSPFLWRLVIIASHVTHLFNVFFFLTKIIETIANANMAHGP